MRTAPVLTSEPPPPPKQKKSSPLAGTTNFVHRYPFSCVSIALTVRKAPVVGVVFNPVLNELFHAVAGGGAFLNGQLISVSNTKNLQSALFATEIGTRRDDAFLDAVFQRMKVLARSMRSVRCGGSCALNLCSVAMGRCVLGKGRGWPFLYCKTRQPLNLQQV
jgi:inositol-phosphate phosphatase/L-galactose 1-phosphate phosphatase